MPFRRIAPRGKQAARPVPEYPDAAGRGIRPGLTGVLSAARTLYKLKRPATPRPKGAESAGVNTSRRSVCRRPPVRQRHRRKRCPTGFARGPSPARCRSPCFAAGRRSAFPLAGSRYGWTQGIEKKSLSRPRTWPVAGSVVARPLNRATHWRTCQAAWFCPPLASSGDRRTESRSAMASRLFRQTRQVSP